MSEQSISNYFTAYEATRKLYSKIQPGTVWGHKSICKLKFIIKNIDLRFKVAYGQASFNFDTSDEDFLISFEYIRDFYYPLEQIQEVK